MISFAGSKRLFCWVLLLLALSGCAASTQLTQADLHLYGGLSRQAPPAARDSLVCVSYNIAYGGKLEQALKDLTSDARLKHTDILLLQEMDPAGVAFLAERLGMNYFYYPSFIHSHHGRLFGTAVLSPWPLSAPRHIVLPYPNQFSDHHRTALAVDVEIADQVVRAVSVHLSTLVIDLEDRLEQAAMVRDSLVADAGPTIIGGDFNSGTHWEVVQFRRVVRKAGFREARIPEDRTARGGPLDLLGYHLKLDHIYYRGLELVAAGSLGDARASDHYPVWTVFRWRE